VIEYTTDPIPRYQDLTMEERIELWYEILSEEDDLVFSIREA
jgi:hypothetical protein